MTDSERNAYYDNKHQGYLRMYWEQNDGTDIYRPNGYRDEPGKLFDHFCEQITHDGKVVDLGCGNGLMLRYLMEHTSFTLIPYGVEFLEPSIRQAREIIHPEYKPHFIVCNIVDYEYKDAPFDFVFANPHYIHPEDMAGFLYSVLSNCADGGRVVFYTYHDALEHYDYSWVGEFPGVSELTLVRRDYPGVSFGIYDK
ncbi:class I SAM-dependent methyltransferase [Candidatus Poribacteria bacterium]